MNDFRDVTRDKLPRIPLIVADTPGVLATSDAERARSMLSEASRFYGDVPLRIGDFLTKRWLKRLESPYKSEIAAISALLGHPPGPTVMNLSYEWGCTSGVGPDPMAGDNRLVRTLDWSLSGLGRRVVVAQHAAGAGPYYNVTWPGFVGVLTAMAPKRFSAAINQPPGWRFTPSRYADWAISRLRMLAQSGWPPCHLLRTVCETCQTFSEARDTLVETPLCAPAFFILSGTRPEESCVIERLPTQAVVHDEPFSIANHWLGFAMTGRETCPQSHARRARMQAVMDDASDDFSWVLPPILSSFTRLAVIASADRGTLRVQGWEAGARATEVFNLPERRSVEIR